MSRKLRVKVSKHSDPDAVVSAGMRRLSRRVLRKLTGHSGRCAVLLPGRDVQSIEIIDNDQARLLTRGVVRLRMRISSRS